MTTPLAQPPEKYEQRWMFLLWKRVVATVLSFTSEAVGFTISGGTTSKTLTVPLDATVSGTNTGDNPGVTSITVTGANGIGVSGSPITSSGTIGLSLGAITPTSVTTPTLYGSAADNGDLTLEGTSSATKATSDVVLQPTGGNVGIGVSSTSNKLSVEGTLDLGGTGNLILAFGRVVSWSSDKAYNSSLTFLGETGNVGKFNAAGGVLLNADNNGSIRLGTVVSNGRVQMRGTSTSQVTAVIEGYPSQTADLLQFHEYSTNAIKARVGIDGAAALTTSLDISKWSADALGSSIGLKKSRSATFGTNTIVQDGDVVGSLLGYGANGSTFTNLASISMEVDGTPGATNDMPGRIVFSTVPDASGTLTEAMRLSQDQSALFANTIKTAAPTTGTAAPWKLGTLVTGQVGLTMLTTQYLEVDVNGSLIKLATI